jgi:hypothetical protein
MACEVAADEIGDAAARTIAGSSIAQTVRELRARLDGEFAEHLVAGVPSPVLSGKSEWAS